MLAKLKKLLLENLGGAARVELVDYEDGLLTFRSRSVLAYGNSAVKIKTSFGTVLAQVSVLSYDEVGHVYRAQVLDSETILNKLRVERRGQPRLSRVMRVSSRMLPGFTATTEDISTSGARITTVAPLEVGTELELKIDLDDANLPPLRLRATVRWSARKANEAYHSGLEFVQEPMNSKIIERFISARLEVERQLHG